MLTSIIGVVVLLGGLIFFHELGHYLVAKLVGVKVEVFSIGFGKKLFKRVIGETEYCLSLFPLGGYVKLMGDDPYKGVPASEAARAFCTQKLYKRFLIVVAGPLANLLLAYVLFVAVFWHGKPMAGTMLGTVAVGSPAWESGLRPRDRITAVAGRPVKTWIELEDTLQGFDGMNVDISLVRGSQELRIPYAIQKIRNQNIFGEYEMVGGIKGIQPNPIQAMVGVSEPQSPAFKAGVRTGDLITKVGTREVSSYEDLNDVFDEKWEMGSPITVTISRNNEKNTAEKPEELSFTVVFPERPKAGNILPLGIPTSLGFYPVELFVHEVTPNGAAEKAGLWPGDRIVKIGEAPIFNFETIVDEAQKWGERDESVSIQLEREGRIVILTLKPIATEIQDPLTRQPIKKYMLGYSRRMAYVEPEMVVLQFREPAVLIKYAVGETNLLLERMVISIWKLIAGNISVRNIGGPVLIMSVAGKSLDAGIIPFLQMMALISINLFLLNLFPIPILDGGHLLFFLVEGIKGRPVSIRTMEIANQLGMVVILLLIGLTLFNDITRIVVN